jgi:hypothetical protein
MYQGIDLSYGPNSQLIAGIYVVSALSETEIQFLTQQASEILLTSSSAYTRGVMFRTSSQRS